MNEALRSTLICVLISSGMLVLGGIFIFIVTRRRHWWLRYTAAEEAFNLKIGIPKKWAAASRRFNESRAWVWFAWFGIIVFLVLTFFSGKLYLRVKHQLAIAAPAEAVSFYDIGAKQNKAGNYAGAISNFTQAIGVYSNYAEAYSFRARAKYNLEDYKGAIVDANKAIELNPDFEPAYNVRGDSRFNLNDYAGSIADFNKSIKLDSTYAPAYNQRGLAEVNLTNYSAAINDFTKAIRLKKDYAKAYYNRGSIEQVLTNYIAAIADFSKAIELHPDFPDAYNRRGLAKWYLKNYNGTIDDCTEAIRLNPKFSQAYNNRGLAKNDTKNYLDAIVDFDKSIELDHNLSVAYYNRGLAKHHLRNETDAIADLNKAIGLNPNDALAYAYLGFFKNNIFQFQAALKNFQTALQLDPSLDECRFRIWLIRSRLDDRLGVTEDLKTYLASLNHKQPDWSDVVGLYLIDAYSEKNLLNCAKSETPKVQNWWRCRANYYIGMKHLIAGDKVGAMRFFQECLATEETDRMEYSSTKVELEAIKKVMRP